MQFSVKKKTIIANQIDSPMLTTISGELLQKLRTLKGLKQDIVARKLGISQPRYCEIEKKKNIQGELLKTLMGALNYTNEEVEKIKQMLPPPLRYKRGNLHYLYNRIL